MWLRGVRGATVAADNTPEAIIEATRELLEKMIEANGIQIEDVASAFFSTTRDLNAEFPAIAARQLGWTSAALMCMHEMDVPHGLPRCVRVMIHWNTARRADEIKHIYIRGAEKLRPDRIQEG
ncbi:MAG: chorismate mutase [Anaerolineae bacterium]|nr:chorismate mutase [Thermoflexales bacterium]MDW8406178.1 chorismate mutase [Anaerolineae bacterium]